MAKQQPDIVIDRLGTHLFRVTRKNGDVSFKWDWDKLLVEVQAATTTTTVSKKNLVKETETKVTKTRAKKKINNQITDAVTAKKPAAKKKKETK